MGGETCLDGGKGVVGCRPGRVAECLCERGKGLLNVGDDGGVVGGHGGGGGGGAVWYVV